MEPINANFYIDPPRDVEVPRFRNISSNAVSVHEIYKLPSDGTCRETLTQKLSSVQDNLPDSADFALLERSQYLLAGFGKDLTLWALPCPGTGAKIQFQLKNPVWNIFAYEQVFLIASAPTQSNRTDCFAVLSAWCPDTKAFLYQTDLCIPRDSPLKDLSMLSLHQRIPKLPAVLISPEKSILLFRWTNVPTNFRSGSNTQTRPSLRSIYAAVCLDSIQKELQFHTRLMLYSMTQPTIFMHEQPFDVSMTKFLTEHLVLSGR
ncbi:unnamed protein product [Dibothriocephalus latus]|uniref:Uncharacterized protein n=1 Tax=Dibothriocephalus latus TaxID=60516 RepID=A0A3P7LSK5_DIBLA|nr:unnamed protein product [Dibothriocephalus latus]